MIEYCYVIIPGAEQGEKSSIFPVNRQILHVTIFLSARRHCIAAALPEVIQTQPSTGPLPLRGGLGAKMKSILPKCCVS